MGILRPFLLCQSFRRGVGIEKFIYGSFLCYPTLVFSLASEHSITKVGKVMSGRHEIASNILIYA